MTYKLWLHKRKPYNPIGPKPGRITLSVVRNGIELIDKIEAGEISISIPGLTRMDQPYKEDQEVLGIKHDQYNIVFERPTDGQDKLFLMRSFDLDTQGTNDPQKIYKPSPGEPIQEADLLSICQCC